MVEPRTTKLGVIGLGYVGLAAAAAFAGAGFNVVGIDIKPERVAQINGGVCPIANEPELPELLAKVTRDGKLVATTDYAKLEAADVVLICVETPVGADHKPRFEALRSACLELRHVMKDGVLVVVESTVAPGTIRDVVLPILDIGKQFHLGYCPERVMPGRLLKNMREMPRVCGGNTAIATELMVSLYGHTVKGRISETDCATAEVVKVAENTYRDVNIAYANELALICGEHGVDFRDVRELVNQVPGRDVHMAGAGVGGHCIPKDSWLLSRTSGLIHAVRLCNDLMPSVIANMVRAAVRTVANHRGWYDDRGLSVAVLGYTYRENSDDTRNSPTAELLDALHGLDVRIHDPYTHPGDIPSADVAVVMTAHDEYKRVDWGKYRAVVDGRFVVDRVPDGVLLMGVGR